jgi:tight adherence protein B
MATVLVLILVFAAVVALGYISLSTFQTEAYERASLVREEEGNVSPLRKMVSPVQMAKYRLNIGFGAAVFFFVLFSALDFSIPKSFLAGAIGAFGASLLPPLWFRRKVAARVELFNSQIMELTNGIAAGMRAGQAFPAALESVSRRIPWPMSEELRTVLREYRLGLDLSEALARMNERLPSEDLALLVGAVKLTTQSGGSLAEVMEKMTELIRARSDFQERLKNLTAQGKFEAIAMSVMPVVVFVILFFENRPLVMPLITTTTGWTAICAVIVLVTCGYLCIRRIVTIEV